jgi:RHS repeat-associated protein
VCPSGNQIWNLIRFGGRFSQVRRRVLLSGELASEHSQHGGTPLYGATYTRDDGGRLADRAETIGGTTTTDSYGYDLAGRLTTVTRDGAPLATYAYDANGNRTSVTTSAGTVVATYDNQDRILTFGDRTYTHTPHGEVSSWADASGTTTLTYDVQGNLLAVQLPSGTTVEYVADARNRRIGRKVNGVVTHRWLYQGQLRPVAELDAGGAVITRFVYGARAVAPEYMIRGGVTYRLVTDQLGSVRLVVDLASGAIAQRIDYDAWGQVVADTNPGFQPFGYAGGLYDSSTGLARFGYRDYAAPIGRWLSKDPILFAGLQENLFSYVINDPINLIDPMGLKCRSFAERWWDNVVQTNTGVPGIFAPVGLSLFTSRIVANSAAIKSPTFLQWALNGFTGIGGFTALETGLITAGTAAVNFAYVSTAFEIGVGVGSAIVAAMPEPCECGGQP